MRSFGLIVAAILMVFAGSAFAQDLWFAFDFETLDVTFDVLTGNSGYADPGFSGNPAEPIAVGFPELVPGIFGSAWSFNGVDTQLNLNDFESMERVYDKETVSVYFNVDATNPPIDGSVYMIYEEGGGTNGMALLIDDDQLIVVARDAGEAFQKEVATPFTDAGNWHHAVIVYNEGLLILYLDGDEVGSLFCFEEGLDGYADQTVDDIPYIHPVSQHTSNAAIGGSQGSCYSGLADDVCFFAGMIDKFKMYKDFAMSGDAVATAVNYKNKLTTTWGSIKE